MNTEEKLKEMERLLEEEKGLRPGLQKQLEELEKKDVKAHQEAIAKVQKPMLELQEKRRKLETEVFGFPSNSTLSITALWELARRAARHELEQAGIVPSKGNQKGGN